MAVLRYVLVDTDTKQMLIYVNFFKFQKIQVPMTRNSNGSQNHCYKNFAQRRHQEAVYLPRERKGIA